jgi:cyclic nucleotide gated channel
MRFIFREKLESCTTDGGRTDFFNSIILKPGDFCGKEILTWALLPALATATHHQQELSEQSLSLRHSHCKWMT